MDRDLPPLIAPFRALRYAREDLRGVLSPPYDVISPARRAQLLEADRFNVVQLILPEGTDKYREAADRLRAWCARGVLARDDEPGVYVLEQAFTTPDGAAYTRTGVIAGLHVEPYDTKRVRPHERTHRGPKEDRLALSRATGAMLESIFVLARDRSGALRDALRPVTERAATASGSLDGVAVRLWRVLGEEAAAIAGAAGAEPVYIADGHHRFETANAYRAECPEATRIPALIVPLGDPGLVVLPTHRIVDGVRTLEDGLLEAWRERFRVEALAPEAEDLGTQVGELAPIQPDCIVVHSGGAYRLNATRETPPPAIAEIETHVVRALSEPGAAPVRYTASTREAVAAASEGNAVAVLVAPTPLEVVLDVADAGGIMPPKSTYFAPKVPSGLVIMPYDGTGGTG